MAREHIERLRRVPLFSACNDKQLEFISREVEDLEFKEGKVLCEEGRSGGDFFIILSGEAEVRRQGRPVDTMGPGDFFGEISLLDSGPRTATVVAKTPMRCLVLGPRQFQDVLHQNGEIAVTMLRAVTRRLRAKADITAD